MNYDNYIILATFWCYRNDMHTKWYKVIKRMAFTNDTNTDYYAVIKWKFCIIKSGVMKTFSFFIKNIHKNWQLTHMHVHRERKKESESVRQGERDREWVRKKECKKERKSESDKEKEIVTKYSKASYRSVFHRES